MNDGAGARMTDEQESRSGADRSEAFLMGSADSIHHEAGFSEMNAKYNSRSVLNLREDCARNEKRRGRISCPAPERKRKTEK